MTGRRMKRSVLTRRFPSRAPPGLTSTRVPGAEPELPVGHHPLPRGESARDDHVTAVGRAGHHRPRLHRLVRLDHEHVLPLLAALHRLRRHDHRAHLLRQVRATLTNWPGQRAFSLFSNVALSWIVPVLGSTVLFMNVSLPRTTPPGWPATCASTGRSPAAR